MFLAIFRTPVVHAALVAPVIVFTGCRDASVSGDPDADLGSSGSVVSAPELQYLEQGWDSGTREGFYFTSQGSQLVPYYWFLALEQADSEELFRSDTNLKALGYIPHEKSRENPDGLPIGFVKDDDPSTAMLDLETRKSYLGSEYKREDYPGTNAWLGFTCAACHTVDITYKGRALRIDGGPALIDHERFTAEMAEAFDATVRDDAKFDRFARRLISTGFNQAEAMALRKRVTAFAPVLRRLVEQNKAEQAYGFGRLDAFGGILNKVCATSLDIPGNGKPSDAPVSYPFLWDTPHLDWVQWNGSADIPIGRNVGEVIGVYAHIQLTGTPETGQFTSTARIQKLARLEDWVSELTAPSWPADVFGSIDEAKAARGERLFEVSCAKCHGVRDADGHFPINNKIQSPKKFIKTTLVPVEKIGTDDRMAVNAATRLADPGDMRPILPESLRELPKVPAGLLLKLAVRETIKKKLAEFQPPLEQDQLAKLFGFRKASTELAKEVYKARPLDGIWATAPYLHNGSVPNLYQLLLPQKRRVREFHVGSNEFDPMNVGFDTSEEPGRFLFRTHDDSGTPIPGNSNQGHSGVLYTNHLDGREFTDHERWELVEYMKTLK